MTGKRGMVLLGAFFCLFVGFSLSAYSADLPLVKILSTGGTIAMKYDPVRGGHFPALKGEDLIEAVPELKKIARVEIENVVNIGSSSMTPDYWMKLLKRANEVLADPAVTAAVVTHGTDTMEETAYFLDLTITSQKPVILVGAQLAASYRDSDGPRNLLNAVRVGLSPEAVGKGVMIVMNGQINAARDATKTNTIMPETFKSWDFGLLGYADLEAVRFYRAPLRRQTIPLDPDVKLSRVEIVFHYAGNDGHLIRALLAQGGMDGLVIAGTGLGHVGAPQYEAVKEVRKQGIPVVIASRVPTGRVIPLYASAGSGVPLKQIGCVRADNLNPWKARILLLLAMTKTKDPEELQKYFDR